MPESKIVGVHTAAKHAERFPYAVAVLPEEQKGALFSSEPQNKSLIPENIDYVPCKSPKNVQKKAIEHIEEIVKENKNKGLGTVLAAHETDSNKLFLRDAMKSIEMDECLFCYIDPKLIESKQLPIDMEIKEITDAALSARKCYVREQTKRIMLSTIDGLVKEEVREIR